jgi:uncharacterized protein (TIRG00374 family)
MTMPETSNKAGVRLVLAAKLAVTLGLAWYLLGRANWGQVAGTVSRIPPVAIAAAFAVMMLSVTISAYKWRYLLGLHGVRYPFRALHRYYFVAVFLNNFLPTSIGGDGYRIYKTLDNTRSRSSSVIAVVMERLTGIIALLAIGYGCAFIVYGDRGDSLSGALIGFGTGGIVAALLVALVILLAGGARRMRSWRNKPRVLRILLEHGRDYLKRPRATAWVMLVSFFFHVHNSLSFYILLNWGVHAAITLPELFVVLTLVNLIAILPISINGLGVVDGAFIYLAGQYGVGYEAALGVMLTSRLLLLAVSAIGAAFFLTERGAVPKPGELRGT